MGKIKGKVRKIGRDAKKESLFQLKRRKGGERLQ